MLEVPHLETALTGPLLHLEKQFLQSRVLIESWFRDEWQKTPPLFYGSVDLRNAGFKLAPVDTNLFPAGFNNLNSEMMALCVQAVQATMTECCASAKRLLLIPESHTRNIFYFENMAMLVEIIKRAGFDVRVGSLLADLQTPLKQTLPSGREIILEPLIRKENKVGVADFFPCCIVLNNDLSSGVPDILKNTSQLFLPAIQLGWATRLKSDHFRFYEQVALEFSQLLKLDSWLINPYFDHCGEVNFSDAESLTCLTERASKLFQKIRKKYLEYKIGHYVVGGFYRLHKNRGINENLNSPGMDFQPLAFAKNCHVPPGAENCPQESINRFYAYGVVGRLAMLAAAREV